ncbi:L domain-like protein [Rhizoclosmatium globosum]|uniref:L domain-like protein n=1 Tax=Rhizoclosmatium globosum TaxID=329046 RepID=A0A1Y2CI28_9FUNG|nr:L domain-like protein [Rhizoclosmatium globosum]|eukprot:ORY46567.1 L domain-like protein [Rhizoclosmatium globosum]
MHRSTPPNKHYVQMTDLPLELVEQIFSWICPQDVWKLRCLSTSLKAILESSSFITMNLRRCLHNHVEFASPESWEPLALDETYWKAPEPYQTAYIRTYRNNLELLSWGVDIDFEDTFLTRTSLNVGIPRQLCFLKHLTILNINGWTIPVGLANLTSLESLYLGKNKLEGHIPLKHLVLAYNTGICGQLPAELGKLTLLETLFIGDTNIEGPIPEAWGKDGVFKKLQRLDLYANQNLTSFIPQFVGKYTELRHLDLSDCGFVGNIPEELGQLSHLETLNLENNRLSGAVPFALTALKQLERFNFRGNHELSCCVRKIFQIP